MAFAQKRTRALVYGDGSAVDQDRKDDQKVNDGEQNLAQMLAAPVMRKLVQRFGCPEQCRHAWIKLRLCF